MSVGEFAFRCVDHVCFFLGLIVVVVYCFCVHAVVLSIETLREKARALWHSYLEVLPQVGLHDDSDSLDRRVT